MSIIRRVIPKFIYQRIRRIKRRLRRKRTVSTIVAVIFIACIIGYAVYMNQRPIVVNPNTYKPLLQLIANAESKDNYNAYFGNASNVSLKFTDMSIAQVVRWQRDYVNQGSQSDAVGRYQIMSTTLTGLIEQLDIDASEQYSEAMQDRLAIALLDRRGGQKYVNHELTAQEFAANLAMEWAALPKVLGENPAGSYYAGDGLNKSLVSVSEVQAAIKPIAAQ